MTADRKLPPAAQLRLPFNTGPAPTPGAPVSHRPDPRTKAACLAE